jgi:hypothetical protein
MKMRTLMSYPALLMPNLFMEFCSGRATLPEHPSGKVNECADSYFEANCFAMTQDAQQ